MARKRGMQFIPYDYEAAYNKAMEDMHEWFIENLFQHRKKVIYALKEITAGDQFEIEIYPQFRSMDEVPPEGRTIKKDNNKAQKNLNDKNAIGIVYVVGAVVVFLAMTVFYIWVDRVSKKEQELYYDEYYYPDDEFAERMSVVVWFVLSLGCAILWVGIPLLICGLIVYTELEEHCPALMGDMTDRNTEEFDKEENK